MTVRKLLGAAAHSGMLATPRAVERKTFLSVRQGGSCKQQHSRK